MSEAAIAIPDDRQPWEKFPGESHQAFSNFAYYRDMVGAYGTRSLSKAAADLGKRRDHLGHQSVKFRWQERVAAYDAYLDRKLREQREDEMAKTRANWTAEGRTIQTLAMRRLVGDPEDPSVEQIHPNSLDARDAAQLIRIGVEVEGRGMGDPLVIAKGGGLLVPIDGVRQLLSDLAAIAERHIPEDRHAAFRREASGLRLA